MQGSGARRGRPSSLTHGQIVDAVIELVHDRPLEQVSMRDIAGRLGVPVMTLYNYVANKDELGTLVIDHILAPVEVPGPDSGDWRQRMRLLQRDARAAMAAHRGVSLRNGMRSDEASRLADGVLSILADAGFGDQQAARAFAVLYTFMLGQIEVDAFLAGVVGSGEPTLETATRAADATPDELFEFGFDAVLAGLDALLGRP